ncbi:hypothetical protein QJQ45_005399 [Haematococcus lacustris]|nr:hypothetical protein QJQ45_005399 [Haematococcus lacustris]
MEAELCSAIAGYKEQMKEQLHQALLFTESAYSEAFGSSDTSHESHATEALVEDPHPGTSLEAGTASPATTESPEACGAQTAPPGPVPSCSPVPCSSPALLPPRSDCPSPAPVHQFDVDEERAILAAALAAAHSHSSSNPRGLADSAAAARAQALGMLLGQAELLGGDTGAGMAADRAELQGPGGLGCRAGPAQRNKRAAQHSPAPSSCLQGGSEMLDQTCTPGLPDPGEVNQPCLPHDPGPSPSRQRQLLAHAAQRVVAAMQVTGAMGACHDSSGGEEVEEGDEGEHDPDLQPSQLLQPVQGQDLSLLPTLASGPSAYPHAHSHPHHQTHTLPACRHRMQPEQQQQAEGGQAGVQDAGASVDMLGLEPPQLPPQPTHPPNPHMLHPGVPPAAAGRAVVRGGRAGNARMHPANVFALEEPDFVALAAQYPELRQHLRLPSGAGGRASFDWTSWEATRQLTACLLHAHFGLTWWLPEGHLVPTVTNRCNYLHWVNDLLQLSSPQRPTPQTLVRGLDVGCGASLIYCLLGAALYGWHMTGLDVTQVALRWAHKNRDSNPQLAALLQVQQSHSRPEEGDPGGILPPAFTQPHTTFDFTVCNPPFFESMEEASSNPGTACGGTVEESCYPGGELAFVLRMLEDSVRLGSRVHWYSSMVGKKSTLKALRRELHARHVTAIRTTELAQGKTSRWAIAWSFAVDRELANVPLPRPPATWSAASRSARTPHSAQEAEATRRGGGSTAPQHGPGQSGAGPCPPSPAALAGNLLPAQAGAAGPGLGLPLAALAVAPPLTLSAAPAPASVSPPMSPPGAAPCLASLSPDRGLGPAGDMAAAAAAGPHLAILGSSLVAAGYGSKGLQPAATEPGEQLGGQGGRGEVQRELAASRASASGSEVEEALGAAAGPGGGAVRPEAPGIAAGQGTSAASAQPQLEQHPYQYKKQRAGLGGALAAAGSRAVASGTWAGAAADNPGRGRPGLNVRVCVFQQQRGSYELSATIANSSDLGEAHRFVQLMDAPGGEQLQGEGASLKLPAEVIERLKFTVFGFDTFWVTSVSNYQEDGVIFKGNVRGKNPGLAYAKMKDRLKVWLSCAFLLGTALSVANAANVPLFQWLADGGQTPLTAQDWLDAAPFMLATAALLGAHEFGHWQAARKHGTDMYLPFIIPAGFGFIGSFGGINRLRSFLPNREALLEFASKGPLLGSAVSVSLLLLGLLLSAMGFSDVGVDSPSFADSFLVAIAAQAFLGQALAQPLVQVNSLMLAGWSGLVVNALACIPLGETDGGRIATALWGRRTGSAIGLWTSGVLALSSLGSALAFYWLVLVLVLQRGPVLPCRDEVTQPQDPQLIRQSLVMLALPLLVLLPYPVELIVAIQDYLASPSTSLVFGF